ncbi:YjfB family protein [Vogesella sp. LYT5W]|uniref:YjfB family protein n=1 Tax=Vogesella margarita TaxID=2984199 RepID=A0ABT5ITG4_9NEIS|nr:YjfB family protein [Vogesella margarita]MDC7715476.1 YjfB family protein [Vogesella margarita]
MAAVSAAADNQVAQAAQILMLKKTMEIGESAALALLATATDNTAPQGNNPPHLGQRIDVRA